jgi:hypothetical protein
VDLNSLLTVARVSDNSIRVRLGALNQAEARYAMVPRTHNVTLLLLVAKDHADPAQHPPPATYRPTVQLFAKTSMVDAERGEALPSRTVDEQQTLLYEALIKRVDIRQDQGGGPSRQDWIDRSASLLVLAQQNRYDDFLKAIGTYQGKDHSHVTWTVPSPQVLWMDLVSLMVGSQFSAASLDLPYRAPPSLPAQDATMADDGESQAIVTLSGGTGLSSQGLSAELIVKKDMATFRFRPERITVSDGGREVAIVFPSLAVHGFTPKADGSELSLQVMAPGDAWVRDRGVTWSIARVLYRRHKEKMDPGFSFTVPAGAIIVDNTGKGSVQVLVTLKGATSATLAVGGADVTSFVAEPADAASRRGTGVAVTKTSVVTLGLQNLDVVTPVTVSAKNESGVPHDVITRPARRADEARR